VVDLKKLFIEER